MVARQTPNITVRPRNGTRAKPYAAMELDTSMPTRLSPAMISVLRVYSRKSKCSDRKIASYASVCGSWGRNFGGYAMTSVFGLRLTMAIQTNGSTNSIETPISAT